LVEFAEDEDMPPEIPIGMVIADRLSGKTVIVDGRHLRDSAKELRNISARIRTNILSRASLAMRAFSSIFAVLISGILKQSTNCEPLHVLREARTGVYQPRL
jgi:hypothetical protein